MANNFQAGHLCPVQLQVAGQGILSTIAVTSHNLDIERLLYDVTNTSHGGDRARISGLRDVKGTVNADFDADVPPYIFPPLIQEGVSGIMFFFYSAISLGRPIQVPIIIGAIHYKMEVGAQTKYSFDVSMNKLAGLMVYPAA